MTLINIDFKNNKIYKWFSYLTLKNIKDDIYKTKSTYNIPKYHSINHLLRQVISDHFIKIKEYNYLIDNIIVRKIYLLTNGREIFILEIFNNFTQINNSIKKINAKSKQKYQIRYNNYIPNLKEIEKIILILKNV